MVLGAGSMQDLTLPSETELYSGVQMKNTHLCPCTYKHVMQVLTFCINTFVATGNTNIT